MITPARDIAPACAPGAVPSDRYMRTISSEIVIGVTLARSGELTHAATAEALAVPYVPITPEVPEVKESAE